MTDFKVWGPFAWGCLHNFIYAYQERPSTEEKENMRQFLVYFGKALPCKTCSLHYMSIVGDERMLNVSLESSDTLRAWGLMMHNSVQHKLHRPILSEEYVYNMYIKDFQRFVEKYDNPVDQSAVISRTTMCRSLVLLLFLGTSCAIMIFCLRTSASSA
jgi:hypothetical protein